MAKTLLERFSDKVLVGDGCWEWTGSKAKGYARVSWQGRPRQAHRLMYELLVGPIPAGLDLDHLCRNRGCVRPSHMEPCSRKENLQRSPIWLGNRERCPRGHLRDGRHCRICERARWNANWPKYREQRRRRRLNDGS